MSGIRRREFLRGAGAIGALGVSSGFASKSVSIVNDPADPVAGAGPVQWALGELEAALSAQGIAVRRYKRVASAPTADLCIVAAGADAATIPEAPESLGIVPSRVNGRSVVMACGRDVRGLMYAVLELADRAQHSSDLAKAGIEQPANKVRGIARLFTSDVEDLPWFNDREMWPHYLTMLATHRFNRFNLSFGIGHDFLTKVTDAYFLFAYPFLLAVPGFDVRVPQISDAERDRNLATLKFISEQTAARGIHFQLGLWMHGYKWIDSPNPKHTIEGLTKETHGPYCRDAVRALLKACPAISGVTFRIHGESGVEEGSFEFWKMVFEGVRTCGRTVEIDMHAKGMNQEMLDLGVATGLPLKVSCKYWAEHMGMPYHQAAIREQERPKPGKDGGALMKFSAGSRSFLRYGYGDLLREDRRWGVFTRIWPGTQRLLLWGDPVTAAEHSRAFSFCGSDGVEICEPLSFKGRRGSGIAGDRCGYADASLRPRWDWQKYEYTYRVWGRLLYNPAAEPDTWQRALRKQFGASASALETALANASRILPTVTTAYCPSAANNSYWPEMYTNQSLVDAAHYQPYSDTAQPRVFANASPLDPQLFSRMNEVADARYSPIEVAQWIEGYAATALKSLAKAGAQDSPEYRRLAIDVSIQAGLGRFFGAKFRAGVLFAAYERTGDRTALDEALKMYRSARSAWAELAHRAKGVYVPDITVGEQRWLRGHWLDRLPAIDADIESVAKLLDQAKPGGVRMTIVHRVAADCKHTPPARFERGRDLKLSLDKPARLFYRHVNQAEYWQSSDDLTIPAAYTDSPYPLQYYFEVGQSRLPEYYYVVRNR